MINKTKAKKKKTKNSVSNRPITNAIIFLCKAVYSQWRVLLTITIIFMLIVLLLAGLTYLFEQVKPGNNFNTEELKFNDAFWWVYVTISTIGYGDIYPISGWMRFWAIIISLIGLSFIALYTAVVVNGFTKEFQKNKKLNLEKKHDYKKYELEKIINELKEENKKLKSIINDLNKK